MQTHETVPQKFYDEPIICPHCGKDSGYTKGNIMFLVIYYDLLCRRCGKVVVPCDQSGWIYT